MDPHKKRNYLVVANPGPGKKRRLNKILQHLTSLLDIRNYNHQLFLTQIDTGADYLVKTHLDESHTDILAIGGDGTINQAINGFQDNKKVFSFIPNGSANDFAKNFDLNTLEKQVRNVVSGKTLCMDLGECNGRKFINGVGIGFDGQVIYELQNRHAFGGSWKYYYHVLKNLACYNSQTFEYSLNNKNFNRKLMLLCIANGTTFGNGFRLTPLADMFDGYLDACVIGELSGIRRFLNVSKLARGNHDELTEVEFHQVKEVRVEKNDMLHAHIDGEYLGKPPYEIKVLPQQLIIRLPEVIRKNGFIKR